MILTPDQFAQQLPYWHHIWTTHNSLYFPVEQLLSEKARIVGYLDIADLVAITHVLGNPYNIRGRVQQANSESEVRDKTRQAILNLADPAAALTHILGIRQWGRAYASKTLSCICPRDYAALDSKVLQGVDSIYISARNEVERYVEFLEFCKAIRQMVTVSGPRDKGEWYIADVEVAFFQFLWYPNNRIV